MRRVFRILILFLAIAGLVGGWAALRANRRTLSYDALADRAGLNRRIRDLRWDGPTLQSATDDLQRLAGIRIKFGPALASLTTDDWLARPLSLHADLHDVSVRTALGLVTRAASAASNYSPDLTMDPRDDGAVWLLDDSEVPRESFAFTTSAICCRS